MKRICIAGMSILLVISGTLIYKNASAVELKGLTLEKTEAILKEYREGNPNGLTQEQIREVLKEYAEANPPEQSGNRSGVGFVNHETGEVIEYVINSGDERQMRESFYCYGFKSIGEMGVQKEQNYFNTRPSQEASGLHNVQPAAKRTAQCVYRPFSK